MVAGSSIWKATTYSDDPDTLDKWMFPSTNPGLTTILPGGHLRIWCDDDEQQGEDHTNFKLSGDGETVFLVEPNGFTIVDSITFGLAQTDISIWTSLRRMQRLDLLQCTHTRCA